MILEYDGTLQGFFCLVHTVFTEKLQVSQIRRKGTRIQGDLFHGAGEEIRQVMTDRQRALVVLTGMARKLSKPVLNKVTQAFLSEYPFIEEILCEYLQRAARRGPAILNDLADPVVGKVDNAAQRVRREYHRYLGLIRFRELKDGVYYAPLRPDTNILPLLPTHFQERFASQDWVIHDVERKTALIYDRKKVEMVEILDAPVPGREAGCLSREEEQFSRLWQKYYKNIAVEGRKSAKRRQQFLPRKTWEFLTEFDGF